MHVQRTLPFSWQDGHQCSLQILIHPWICAPGTHYGWVGRGNVEYKVCPILVNMTSTGNRTQDLPTSYQLDHVFLHTCSIYVVAFNSFRCSANYATSASIQFSSYLPLQHGRQKKQCAMRSLPDIIIHDQDLYLWPLGLQGSTFQCLVWYMQAMVEILTLKVLVTTIDAHWEGMGDVGSARYESALLPPCPTIRVLSYSN